MNPRTYRALVKNGTITVMLWQNIYEYIKKFEGKTIKISVEEHQPQRSSNQNSFWWAVIIPEIRGWFTELGYNLSADECHDYVVSKVWKWTEVIEIEGDPYERRLSSTKLTKAQWAEKMDLTYQFFAEKGLVLSLPEKEIPVYRWEDELPELPGRPTIS